MNPDIIAYLNSLSEDQLWTLYENLDSLDYKSDDQMELLYHIEEFFMERGEQAQNEQEREEFFADWAAELLAM